MPISYRIDVERNLVLTTASGTLTDDDVIQLKARPVHDPEFNPEMKELSDLRGIHRFDITPDGVRAMVQQDIRDSKIVATHKLALVVSREVSFGMARMYQTMTNSTIEQTCLAWERDNAEAIDSRRKVSYIIPRCTHGSDIHVHSLHARPHENEQHTIVYDSTSRPTVLRTVGS